MADYHKNPKPEKAAKSGVTLSSSFFYFYTNTNRKKKYKSTERAKVAENQQIKAVLFWTFQECGVVRTVQKYGTRKEWYGEGGGRRVQDGEHTYTCGGFILIFGKTNTFM